MKKLLTLILAFTFVISCSKNNEDLTVEGSTITSKVLAPNGTDPIPGASVTLIKQGNEINQTLSGIDGKFVFSNVEPGEYTISISKGMFSVLRSVNTNNPITICHIPPGNPENPQTITISENAWAAHEAHGDTLGACDEGDDENHDEINLEDFIIDNLPNIAVVTGSYDNIESVLFSIGLVDQETGEPLFDIIDGNGFNKNDHSHGHSISKSTKSSTNPVLQPNVDFTFEELLNDVTMLEQYDIIFFNCGLSTAYISNNENINTYVQNGGILYATDWAYEYLNAITNGGQDYIDFYQPYKSGSSTTTMATVGNPELLSWLDVNFGIAVNDTIEINEFLGGWQVVASSDAETVLTWFNGEVTYNTDTVPITENKDLMFTFAHGDGYVLYSSFHTENHDDGFSNVDRIMEYQIFDMTTN